MHLSSVSICPQRNAQRTILFRSRVHVHTQRNAKRKDGLYVNIYIQFECLCSVPSFFEKMAPTLSKLMALNEEQFLLIVSLFLWDQINIMLEPSILVIM